MNSKIHKLKTKFKNAKNIQQIIIGLKQLLTLIQTNKITQKELEVLYNTAQKNNYHPNKEFKIKYKEDSKKYWDEYKRIAKYPATILGDLDWQGKQNNKENHSLAHGLALSYCAKHKLRAYVNKNEEIYTKHYSNAYSKYWSEEWEKFYSNKEKKLFQLRTTVNKIEREILLTYQINELRKQYKERNFMYLLDYGKACMKRNGFNKLEKYPSIDFTPSIIELAKTITFTPPKTAHNQKTITSKL